MSDLRPADYGEFLLEIKTRVRRRQYQALRAANAELTALYWEIGEAIHRKQQALGWGKAVVETLHKRRSGGCAGLHNLPCNYLPKLKNERGLSALAQESAGSSPATPTIFPPSNPSRHSRWGPPPAPSAGSHFFSQLPSAFCIQVPAGASSANWTARRWPTVATAVFVRLAICW